MNKVYLVITSNKVEAGFSTIERAEKFLEALSLCNTSHPSIEELELDIRPLPYPVVYLYMDASGFVSSVTGAMPSNPFRNEKIVYRPKGICAYFCIRTSNWEEAIKEAHIRRELLLKAGVWGDEKKSRELLGEV